MGRIVVIEKNEAGKVELTKEELQKMLDDAYSQGYSDGNRTTIVTSPYWPNLPTNAPYTFDTDKSITTCNTNEKYGD